MTDGIRKSELISKWKEIATARQIITYMTDGVRKSELTSKSIKTNEDGRSSL